MVRETLFQSFRTTAGELRNLSTSFYKRSYVFDVGERQFFFNAPVDRVTVLDDLPPVEIDSRLKISALADRRARLIDIGKMPGLNLGNR